MKTSFNESSAHTSGTPTSAVSTVDDDRVFGWIFDPSTVKRSDVEFSWGGRNPIPTGDIHVATLGTLIKATFIKLDC